MSANINITPNERLVIEAIRHNQYQDAYSQYDAESIIGHQIWGFAVNDSEKPSGIEGKALSGVLSSLCKKGLVVSEEYDQDSVLWLTEKGVWA